MIRFINVDLQNLIACCITDSQLSHRSARSLLGRILCLFKSRSHNDWEVGLRVLAMTVNLLLVRLTKNLGTWINFSRIEKLIWRRFGFFSWMKITFTIFSKDPCFKFLFFALLGRHVFVSFLHQMEEWKEEDESRENGGQACWPKDPSL